jgi:hypothetical protein
VFLSRARQQAIFEFFNKLVEEILFGTPAVDPRDVK